MIAARAQSLHDCIYIMSCFCEIRVLYVQWITYHHYYLCIYIQYVNSTYFPH